MYILTVEDSFAAAHQLNGYMGKCENLHGHNWKIELEVAGHVLNDIGLLIDFHDLKDILKSVLADLDHVNLNETELFSTINPSSENIVWKKYTCSSSNRMGIRYIKMYVYPGMMYGYIKFF